MVLYESQIKTAYIFIAVLIEGLWHCCHLFSWERLPGRPFLSHTTARIKCVKSGSHGNLITRYNTCGYSGKSWKSYIMLVKESFYGEKKETITISVTFYNDITFFFVTFFYSNIFWETTWAGFWPHKFLSPWCSLFCCGHPLYAMDIYYYMYINIDICFWTYTMSSLTAVICAFAKSVTPIKMNYKSAKISQPSKSRWVQNSSSFGFSQTTRSILQCSAARGRKNKLLHCSRGCQPERKKCLRKLSVAFSSCRWVTAPRGRTNWMSVSVSAADEELPLKIRARV